MTTASKLESPLSLAASAVLVERQSALMAVQHTYFLAREAYEAAIIAGGDGLPELLAYDDAIKLKAAVYAAMIAARDQYKASKQEMTVRV